ncbi:monovalent cation/H+ antiporter complex subunit F [Propionimicrobium lymphophilum]|uniref:monovalent cation/H+ antiporter complex subunit F n=1 Tax=Propionimicrobium lymphophilum TaxID=33012 RepID=UPI0003FD3E14|nr:monovalent cation/H+ antiporter complex subunit F [Propionimicrobium lymphophilum]
MIYLLWAALIILGIAMALVLIAVLRGPTVMERAISLDVLTSAIICTSVVIMVIHGRTDLTVLVAVLAAVGFVSSTVIARFAPVERKEETMSQAAVIGKMKEEGEDA